MTNLFNTHEVVLEAFHNVEDDTPQCFIAYTIKGYGTITIAGHRDNHAGLMTIDQMDLFKNKMKIPEGSEWSLNNLSIEPEIAKAFCMQAPFNERPPSEYEAPKIRSQILFHLISAHLHLRRQASQYFTRAVAVETQI